MADNGLAIDLHHVEKRYGRRVHALRGIEMQVHAGEVFGLLGPNGAGKSTLVKIMMTVVRPTKATGTVLGEHIGHKATLRRVGYLPEHARFPSYLTGRQVVSFYGAMASMTRDDRKRRVGEMIDLVGASDYADRKIKTYSKGMQQRIGLAQAMVNDPDLVVLDEPTDGVDPVGRRDIREALLEIRKQNKTVFVNSHLLSELEMICNRVAILVQGQVARQGTIDDLTADQHHYRLVLDSGVDGQAADLGRIVAGLPDPGFSIKAEGGFIKLLTDDAAAVQPVIDRLRADGRVIREVRPHRPSLEDLFMQAMDRGENGGGV